MRDMVERPANRLRDSMLANLADGHDEIACLDRVLMHCAAIGEARKPDLCDVRARQPILDQGAHRVAVA